jgi:hypothetical protein
MQKILALTPHLSFSPYTSKKIRFGTALTLYFKKGPSFDFFAEVFFSKKVI